MTAFHSFALGFHLALLCAAAIIGMTFSVCLNAVFVVFHLVVLLLRLTSARQSHDVARW